MSQVSRRDFIKMIKKVLAATGLTSLLAPVLAYLYPPSLEETPEEPVLVASLDQIPIGSSVTVPFGRYPALVIHTAQGLKAYSAVCTHFSCIVKWDQEQQIIFCPCHDGFFEATTGEVISGPPPLPLETLPLSVEDGDIYLGGSA